MLQHTTFSFLEALSRNNNKEWFDAHKKDYMQAKDDVSALVAQLLRALSQDNSAFAVLTPKDCLFRMNRDVRFSKNKEPYKINFGASMCEGGKKSPLAGYYLHVQPGASFIGGGIWMPEPEVLRKIRQEIDYNFEEFQSILKTPALKKVYPELQGDKLQKPPKGYEADNPAIAYIRHKSFIVSRALSNKELENKQAVAKLTHYFEVMQDFIGFLNRAVRE